MSALPIQLDFESAQGFAPFDLDRALLTAQIHAVRLVGRSYARHADREDLVQELLATAVRQWPKFNPMRGAASTFLSSIMGNHSISLGRRQNAAKRGNGRCERLTEKTLAGLAAAYVDSAVSFDVETAIKKLPDHLQTVCDLLKVHSPAQTARALRVSRQQLSSWISELGCAFQGLEREGPSRGAYK